MAHFETATKAYQNELWVTLNSGNFEPSTKGLLGSYASRSLVQMLQSQHECSLLSS